MENLTVRCSELSKLMTKGRSKNEPLGETTKSYLMQKAKEDFYGIFVNVSTKYMDKGIMNENKAIKMLNNVYFTDYYKNDVRKTNEWLTGECDILAPDKIIDIKCSWSFDTFPAFYEEAEKSVKQSGYDWQMRGYMMLFDRPKAEVTYCLTSTPDELLTKFDDVALHKVDHINPALRVTSVTIERDLEIEAQMYEQYQIANEYYNNLINQLKNK